jgi:plasmid stabilization system protein ParE
MFRLEWTERARQEFESALAYIAEENPANAQLVKDRTFRTIAHLEFFSLGTAAPAGTCKIYIPKTSYFLLFRRSMQSEIMICAFVHASRDWEQIDWEKL